jgi:arylsulfatase A
MRNPTSSFTAAKLLPAILSVLGGAALFGLARPARAADVPAKPNIVFILADDLGWGDVAFNGRKDWGTPSLDRLATQGTVFTRWYAGAVVCAPSRGCLLTGKYTIHSGVSGNSEDLPAEQVTIAEALKAQGYATALFGKWHHGQPRMKGAQWVHPMDQGFDEFFGYTDARACWEKFPKTLWEGRKEVASSGYGTTLFTDRSIDFVKRHRGGPFFLYLAYTEPHFNIAAPPEDVKQYAGKFPEQNAAKPVNATYAAMISRMDKEIGRVLAALDAEGLADNTLVVFTSDQGATFEKGNEGVSAFHDSNRPFRGQKRTLWEGGTRVPAIVRWPGKVPAAKSSEQVLHMIDLLPTFLAAAGGKPLPEWGVDGANVLPVWMGQSAAPERTLFWEWRVEGSYQLAAMRGNMKLVVPCEAGKPELFDVAIDPAERRDISALHPELARQLRKEIEGWLATEKYAKPAASESRKKPSAKSGKSAE